MIEEFVENRESILLLVVNDPAFCQSTHDLSNPHPNITGERAWKWLPKGVLGAHAKRWGWTEKMIAEGLKLIETEGDPDGPEPDWALSKAMLSYAYKKASQ
jgi:hypothetical protein